MVGRRPSEFSPRRAARAAGVSGLVMLVAGSYAGQVASRTTVHADAAATARNLAASEPMVRLGILGGLVMMIGFLLYAVVLDRLLRPVGRLLSSTMLALALASVPLFMLNQAFQVGALHAARAPETELARVLIEMHRFGNLVGAIFFGLWLLPLGILVLRSGFLPPVIGVLLVVSSPGYVVLFTQGFFFPGSEQSVWRNPLLVVTHAAELSLMFWLLARGVNERCWRERDAGAEASPSRDSPT